MPQKLLSIDSKDRDSAEYPQPNKYSMCFPKISAVTSVTLVNTVIPNCSQAVREDNNKLTWRTLNDEEEHEVCIPKGSYSFYGFQKAIERVQAANWRFKFDGGIADNVISIRLCEPYVFSNPFSVNKGSHEVVVDAAGLGNLRVGDEIHIQNSNACLGLDSDLLNGIHHVTKVQNSTFSFDLLSPARVTQQHMGGSRVEILKPVAFQLVFDRPDSIGKLLGFPSSRTKFGTVHTNADMRAMRLSGPDYYFLKCPQLSGRHDNTSGVDDVFAKMLLTEPSGNLIYSSFVAPCVEFEEPLDLDHLDIEFVEADNRAVDFRGLDHSLVLKLESRVVLPQSGTAESK